VNEVTQPKVGDTAVMRKPHACGSFEWEITRVGADIGIRCLGCRRRVLLERPYFVRRAKEIKPGGG
jgi:hypothetical protein